MRKPEKMIFGIKTEEGIKEVIHYFDPDKGNDGLYWPVGYWFSFKDRIWKKR